MCIRIYNTINWCYKPFVAWKVTKTSETPSGIEYTGPFSRTRVQRDVWLQAKNQPLGKMYSKRYGFCVFRNRHDAEQYGYHVREAYLDPREVTTIRKVLCKGICHIGKHHEHALRRYTDAAYVKYIKFVDDSDGES